MIKVWGQSVGETGTCRHYHSELDVVAQQCAGCQRYYACYQCHDELENHVFQPASTSAGKPVLCGACQTLLTYEEYQLGVCPTCQHPFNPVCALHHDRYFQ